MYTHICMKVSMHTTYTHKSQQASILGAVGPTAFTNPLTAAINFSLKSTQLLLSGFEVLPRLTY
jgi:hypothetical protein